MKAISHYALDSAYPVILEMPAGCVPSTEANVFAYGWQPAGLRDWFVPSPHREDYTKADAQAVVDMLNVRLKFIKQPSQTVSPPDGECGMPAPSVCQDGAAFELDNCTAAKGLTGSESY